MKRLFLIGLIIIGVVVAVSFILSRFDTCGKAAMAPPPVNNQAAFEIRLWNRSLYTNQYAEYTDNIYGKYIIVKGYWSVVGDNWKYNANPIKLLAKDITIIPRTTPIPTKK